MLDAAARARLLDRHGAAAEGWLDALPTRLSALAERWWVALDLASPPLAGGTSVVVRGHHEGAPVMLKLALDPEAARAEAAALRVWGAGSASAGAASAASAGARAAGADAAGAGGVPPVPRLLRFDGDAGALLLERIVPGGSLLDEPGPADAAACGGLLRALRAPAPPEGLPSLRERVEFVFALWLRRAAAEPGPRAAVPARLLERGRDAARELAADPAAPVALVHGDLHPGNVLDGGPARGLVAIDPRPCVGDPAFDAADLVLHGAESVAVVRERTAQIAAHTGGDPDRLAAWCAALAALDAAALTARHGDAEPTALATLLTLAV